MLFSTRLILFFLVYSASAANATVITGNLTGYPSVTVESPTLQSVTLLPAPSFDSIVFKGYENPVPGSFEPTYIAGDIIIKVVTTSVEPITLPFSPYGSIGMFELTNTAATELPITGVNDNSLSVIPSSIYSNLIVTVMTHGDPDRERGSGGCIIIPFGGSYLTIFFLGLIVLLHTKICSKHLVS